MNASIRKLNRGDRRGMALLMVVVALAILLGLALPFLLSVTAENRAVKERLAAARSRQASVTLRDALLRRGAASDETLDMLPENHDAPTMVDVAEEFPFWDPPEDSPAARWIGAQGQSWGGEVWDAQSKIAVEGAGPLVYANILGWSTMINDSIEAEADELVVVSTRGFDDAGYLWVMGELVQYTGRTATSFTGCTRGVGWEENASGRWRQPRAYFKGIPVVDVRAWHLATYPVIRTERKSWQPWTSFEEMAVIGELGHGGLNPGHIERLRALMTLRSSRGASPAWVYPQRLLHTELRENGTMVAFLNQARYFNTGCLFRVRGPGKVEYGVVYRSGSAAGRRTQMLTGRGGALVLEEPLTQAWEMGEGTVEVLAPMPVNLNTASEKVLTQLFAWLRHRGFSNRPQQRGGAAADQGAVKDWVSPEEAKSLAKMFIDLRRAGGGDGTGPFVGPKDLVDRVLKLMISGGGAFQVDPRLMGAIYKNMLNSLDRGVTLGTAPLSLWSGPVVGYRAAVATFDPGGAERARSERSGFAFVRPEGIPLALTWSSQAQFDELFRLSRGARGWISLPNNTSFLDNGNDPPSRYVPHAYYALRAMRAEAAPEGSMEPVDGTEFFPLEKGESSSIKPAPARLANSRYRVGRRGLMHMDRAPDPEGRDVGQHPLLINLNTQGSAQVGNARVQVTVGGRGNMAQPLQGSFWFQPARGGSMTLFDVGRERVGRDRVHLYVDSGYLTLEVLDTAGLDPEPGGLNPRRTASAIRIPLSEYPLNAETWYHHLFQVQGNSPERLSYLLDGVPRGRSRCLTRLAQEIEVYDHQDETDRYLDVVVEDAEGFPAVGTLRIGTELFEYTSRSGNTFNCKRADSRGGRDARHSGWEWNTENRNRPDNEEGVKSVPAPGHQAGETVTLYGYSIALKPETTVPIGEWKLPSEIGPWGVARMVNADTSITVGNRALGDGIDERHRGDLELAAPVVQGSGAGGGAGGTANNFMGAFQKEGGYALLCQRMLVVQSPQTGQPGGGNQETKVVGGLVGISYRGVKGNKLTGVTYGVTIPILSAANLAPGGAAGAVAGLPGLPGYFDGQMRPFIGKWANKELEEAMGNWAYVVPISLKLTGNLTLLPDPQNVGHSEYVQILPKRQAETEWVRYDAILQDTLLRCNPDAVQQLLSSLGVFMVNRTTTTYWPPASVQLQLNQVQTTRADEIGYIPAGTLPINYWAGYRFRFRGARETRTSTHAHDASAIVLPVFRVEERWGPTASIYGRPGRKDRIALVEGNQDVRGNNGPQVEWHTVNWSVRLHYWNSKDPYFPEQNGPCNLVALEQGVNGLFSQGGGRSRGGRGSRTTRSSRNRPNQFDARELTRIVKFPSGEMPWRFTSRAQFGMPQTRDEGWPADGLIDEVEIGYLSRTVSGIAANPMVGLPVGDKGATRIQLLTELAMPGRIASAGNRLARYFPRYGGLVQIGEEILAYREVTDAGALVVATNGRGLLGTTPSAHGLWEQVTILERPAATTLNQDCDGGSPILGVVNAERFPVDRGLVLVDQELIHYVYSRQYLSLEMPARQPSAREMARRDQREYRMGDGLFRGRFGTTPQAHPAGTAVIFFPFRYWDTWSPEADAPEMHHFDVHLRSPRAYFQGLTWTEDLPNELVDLQVLVRVDGRAEWREKPDAKLGLWRFDAPTVDGAPNAIGLQGNHLALRFFTVYKSGAFDPVAFLAQAWKTAPVVREVKVLYEAPTVILEEKEASR